MHPDLAIRGLSYGVIGLLLLVMLVLALISLRKEARRDEPLRGLLWFTLVILGLCTFIALPSAYQAAKSQNKLGPRLQTERVELQ
jgi:multisubunit Na+/H+ antiporter MnhB subunit